MLDGRVIAEVPLPIGGLMSDQPARRGGGGGRITWSTSRRRNWASRIDAPFMHLSFLGLSVIPQLRITDRGLVDVDKFALTGVAAD